MPGVFVMRFFLPAIFMVLGCSEYTVSGLGDQNAGAEGEGGPGSDGDGDGTGNLEDGDIWGQICDPSGVGWAIDAHVYVDVDVDGDGVADWRAEDWTDEAGAFELVGVPTGEHTVYVEKGSFTTDFNVLLDVGGHQLPEAECLDPESVNIAVVTGQYDAIEDILQEMNLSYDLYEGSFGQQYLQLLSNPDALAEYDIVFLNCGISENWIGQSGQIGQSLMQYVSAGGSIYASDWAYYFVETGWPEAADFYGDDQMFSSAYVGKDGNIKANVINAEMQSALGSDIADINFDLSSWAVIESVGNAEVLLRGDAEVWDMWGASSALQNVPLAFEIQDSGKVIYTTFHNERQITLDMQRLLTEMVLSL